MDRSEQCDFPQDIPSDLLVQVGESKFPLHKIMLMSKCSYIRRLILESEEPDLLKIDLSNIPGGPEIFEKITNFCYGVNFEITVNNIAALHCAAVYLEMTDEYCDGNLVSRTFGFLTHVALSSLSGAVTVLKSCENLLPIADELNIVHQCVQVTSDKAFEEAKFPSRSPWNWWAEELSILQITFFHKIIHSMKSRGAKPLTIAAAITTYAQNSVINTINSPISDDSRIKQRELLESIVSLMPAGTDQQTFFSTNFLCCLLRAAVLLENNDDCEKQLEKRISAVLEHVTVDDLLILCDLESVRRIVSGFVEKKTSEFNEVSSPAMIRVVKTVDAYLGEIARASELSVTKLNGIANLVPKNVRQVDDDLYRAIDIYLQAHPTLDEIEREKVCNAMDPLKLSAEARVHASQNKRLPLQTVLHTLYYDQLQERSVQSTPSAQSMRFQVHADVSLAKENEKMRSELLLMKMYLSDMEKKKAGTSKSVKMKKPTFFSSMSKTFGKLNPFKQGSEDTSNIVGVDDHTKPRRRRFSM